jgi:hypothetical protein
LSVGLHGPFPTTRSAPIRWKKCFYRG